MKSPEGAITTMDEVEQLLERAKERDVPVYHLDTSDGSYFYRVVTSESYYAEDNLGGLHYFNRTGSACRSGMNFLEDESWLMFTNWWFLYAWALRAGFRPCELEE